MALFKTENSAGDVLDVTDLDFVGDGVDVSIAGTTVSVAIPGNPPGGSVGAVQYKTNPKTHGGAANVSIDTGDLSIKDNPTPTAPIAGNVKLFCEDLGGRKILGQIGPSGLDTPFQPFLGRNKVCYWSPIGNVATVPIAFGIASPTIVTAATRNVATTNMFQSLKRMGAASAATAQAAASYRSTALQFWRGNAANCGGWTFICRFGISDTTTAISGAKMFVGLNPTSGAYVPTAGVEASAQLNSVGVCQLSTSTNLHFMTNDGAGTATTTDLGANFPCNTINTDIYEIAMFCAPNATTMTYAVRRLNTGHEVSGTVTTKLPVNTALLTPHMWRTNNTVAAVAALDLFGLYIETDF